MCERAEQCRLVWQNSSQHGIAATLLHDHFRKGHSASHAEVAPDPKRVEHEPLTPHGSIFRKRLVRTHRPDLVNAGFRGVPTGEKAQVSSALDGFGPAVGAKLRIDVADMRVHGIDRDVKLACDIRPGEIGREVA